MAMGIPPCSGERNDPPHPEGTPAGGIESEVVLSQVLSISLNHERYRHETKKSLYLFWVHEEKRSSAVGHAPWTFTSAG